MCFSATASFTASFALLGAGIYCLKTAANFEKPYWLFALVPLLFGLQQFLEGLVWLGGASACTDSTRTSALGYLFFSHLLWLIWIPLSCYAVENNLTKKKVFFVLLLLGALSGLSAYLPLLLIEERMTVIFTSHALVYSTILLFDQYIPRKLFTLFYIVIIILPLLAASDRHLKCFGLLILFSVVTSIMFFDYAFISKWCYIAAVFSFFIVYMLFYKNKSQSSLRE